MAAAFRKLDRALGEEDSGGLGLLAYRGAENLVATSEKRPRRGWITWDRADPLRIGCVREMAFLMDVPLSAEASAVKLKVYGHVYHDDFEVGGAVTLGPGVSGPEATPQTLSAGEQVTGWITVDVTGWQVSPERGELAEVQLRVKSTSTATATTRALIANSIAPWRAGGFCGVTGRTGAYASYDVIGLTPKISSKVLDGYAEDDLWTVRNNTATASGNDLFIVYPWVEGEIYATHADFKLYSRFEIYAILWEEVISAPYLRDSGSVAAIEDEDVYRLEVLPGRPPRAEALGRLYRAGEYLATQRTPCYYTRPTDADNQDPTNGWLATNSLSLGRKVHIHGGDNGLAGSVWFPLGWAPVSEQEGLGGVISQTARTAVDVIPTVYTLTRPGGFDVIVNLRLRSIAATTLTTSATGETLEGVVWTSVAEDSPTGIALGVRDETPGSATDPVLGAGIAYHRLNLQGLWELKDVGRTGKNQGPKMTLNDPAGLAGKIVVLEAQIVTRATVSFVMTGMSVVGAQGSAWEAVGT